MAGRLAGAGGKKKVYELGQNADINVTPFVDIMLVLLIVMMVAVPVATLAIKVDLPPATPSKEKPKPPTYISLYSNGGMNIVSPDRGSQATGLDRLAGDLVTNLGPNAPNESILIRANRDVRYGDFMAVVNQLQTDGFYKVSLITEGDSGGGA